MGDQFRKVEQYSPKSSPRGARSPVVSRQDSSGTLKTTILLGKNPSIVPSGPFYLMKEPPGKVNKICWGSNWQIGACRRVGINRCDKFDGLLWP